jgi:hypothetical protein
MGQTARRYAERFDWSIIANRIHAVYEQLLDGSRDLIVPDPLALFDNLS